MWTFLLGVIFGLLASSRSDQLQVNARSCSYEGVFQAEGAGRHTLTFEMAKKVCVQQDSIIANRQQVEEAYNNSMETCRNGWISNENIAILRHTHHENCVKNMTGFIINSNVQLEDRYDVYCYDESAGPGRNCTKTFKIKAAAPTEEGGEAVADTTPTSQSDDDFGNETDHSTAAINEDALDVTMQAYIVPTELSTEESEVVPKQLGRNDSGRVDYFVTTMEPESGSGTEENPSPKSPVEEPTTAPPPDKIPNQTAIEDRALLPPASDSDKQNSHSSSDWIVIIIVILAVAAIFIVCVVVAKSKSWCGRKQTLMITAKDGSEGNGTAAAGAASSSHNHDREQEMVTLMNKENIQENGNTEDFTVIKLEESPDKDQQA